MPIVINTTLNQIRSTAAGSDDRPVKARRLAEMIRKLGEYRWVGIYDVSPELISVVGWSGLAAPEYPMSPANEGLSGVAIQSKRTLIIGDVRDDPRYLTTFPSTVSEIIVPVISPGDGRVIGTVDVESDVLDAFSASDQRMIEQCAEAALPLWLLR